MGSVGQGEAAVTQNKVVRKSLRSRSKIDQKSIKRRSKIDPKSIQNRFLNGMSGVARCDWQKIATEDPPTRQQSHFWGANLGPSCAQNPLRSCSNFRLRFGSSFGASWARFRMYFGRVSGSNFAPRTISKLKRPMCTKLYYLQYGTMVFAIPGGFEIEEKSMPKTTSR